MICVDTTVLIDIWRSKDHKAGRGRMLLERYAGEHFAVPVGAAGEFLEGAAFISEARLQEALLFLDLFHVIPLSQETAIQYARAVSFLRKRNMLKGASKFDLWNAATALEHGAKFVTRNVKDLKGIPGLMVESYD